MKGHGIDGEVATGEVLSHVVNEAHLVGMAMVAVGALDPIGRNLYGLALDDGGQRPVGGTRLVHLDVAGVQDALYLLPARRGRDVHIVGRAAAQGVSHPAPDDPGLGARTLERLEHAQRVDGNEAGKVTGKIIRLTQLRAHRHP